MRHDESLLLTCLASGSAGLVGRMLCHPMDTIKAKLQSVESPTSFLRIVRDTWRKEKINGFYRGIGAVLVGGVPGVCLYLSSYEYCKQQLETTPLSQQYPFYKYMLSGITAEAIW
ncbi:solute carrier family 25 protein [archaeon]|nr:MAG: solute carrier family 25 protein [archaeon]